MIEPPSTQQQVVRVELVGAKKAFLERLSSYVPLFISVLALGTSIWSAYATRVHNKLTVKPSIGFMVDLASPGAGRVGLSFRNDGFGPATISDLAVYLDGKRIQNWLPIFLGTNNLFKPTAKLRWSWFSSDIMLRPGEVRAMLTAEADGINDILSFDNLIASRLFVIVKTCSVYDDCEFACSTADNSKCEEQQRLLETKVQ